MEETLKCEECGKKDCEEIWSLSEYGDNRYGLDTRGREYCSECFKKLEEMYDIPSSFA